MNQPYDPDRPDPFDEFIEENYNSGKDEMGYYYMRMFQKAFDEMYNKPEEE